MGAPRRSGPQGAHANISVEYTLGRLCTDLRTTYALDDRPESGSAGDVESTTDLTDAFRLRYELTSTASPASRPVVATPEIRCTK